MSKFTIAIHGGAGTILKELMTPDLETAYTDGLKTAVDTGFAVLEQGGAAVNAVKAAIVVLEDNILFNAGRGSVFTKKGVQEMDAAIMTARVFFFESKTNARDDFAEPEIDLFPR